MDDGRAEVDGLLGGARRVANQDGSALDDVDDGNDEEDLERDRGRSRATFGNRTLILRLKTRFNSK